MATLYAGTSGFAYAQWKPDFYPEKLPATRFLEHYAGRLNSVEINYTFRRMPPGSTLENWVRATPRGFLFAVKAHQRITHVQRLKDAGTATEIFLRAIDPLRATRRLGPVLFQLPPNLRADTALLAEFLAQLPGDVRYAFEFRHASWLTEAVYDLLGGHNVALCLAEAERLQIPEVVTADFVYYRLRMPSYSEAELGRIGARCEELLAAGKDVFVYFKHEETPQGALYAESLLQRVRRGSRT
ncbi:MAG: DUF72 domain-containing protein [Bryobacterales bacterium]|nr:DUF72 domain-containing protein [Bryobacteraceae bacterium]MDW8354925.1 DUF72 domain-containing protein [Bryobacterales bacterium]